ncbi:flavodoxin family protein [Clostridium sp. KNHs214]|uniref:flavodoxin family protein n=1 Tax=Clostridium sp. KNHs214 TaxID=1540257 RepID=UPI0005599D65|nr:flavodoxin family protein [Clostridium sp. KNHs214]
MKKVLSIVGSPRKGKNTDFLLNKVLKGMDKEEVHIEKIYLRDLDIAPCTSCYYCSSTGKCCINDDMQKLYKAFDESDCTIIASPLYFNTVSSLTKIMIDRCQMFWSSKYQLNNPSIDRDKKRIGVFLCVGGAKEHQGQFDASIPVADLFLKAVNAKCKYSLFCANTDEVPVWERQDILDKAFIMGKNILKEL